MRKAHWVVAGAALGAAAILTAVTVPGDSVAAAAKKIYSGTLYIAGMGGHFAKAEVTIDPGDAKQPIKIKALDRIVIGSKDTHPTHDPRIDARDRTKMYWSTYRADPAGKMHVGVSDLKTGEVIKDIALALDGRAKLTKSVYCASGQSENSYIPVTMTDEPYIDVLDKASLALKHRVFLDYKPGETKFYHGINSPDMKKFFVAVNRAVAGKPNGKIDLILLDLPALESGKVKVLAKNTISGTPEDTVTFRQYFSVDGKRIYQSGADRLLVIDAASLKLIGKTETPDGTEVHDAMPTPDGKYVVMAIRKMVAAPGTEGMELMDGFLMLYDVAARKIVNEPVSVCAGCHDQIGLHATAMLCGVDGNWK
jgi:hypothetical protein